MTLVGDNVAPAPLDDHIVLSSAVAALFTAVVGPQSAVPTTGKVKPCVGKSKIFDPESKRELDQAKALCSSCPFKNSCYAFAFNSGNEHGVWGGEYFYYGTEMDETFIPRPKRTA